jgi:transcriptional regulator of acetoin/glycerol metabolism
LGGTKTIPIDVRLLAATNRNLTQMMGDKLFRSDLYYRLKVFPITTPPLLDHPEDIPLLARHLTKKYAALMDRKIEKIPVGDDANTGELALAWECSGVGKLHGEIGHSLAGSKPPGAIVGTARRHRPWRR